MKPVNLGGHASYRSALRKAIKQNGIDLSAFPKSTQNIYKKFRDLDLSQVDSIMKDKYFAFGPIPRLPSCMLRSLLIALAFKITSITDWVAALRITPFYAILSGFSPNDTPGVGTFYDFIHRLWDGSEKNFSPNVRPMKEKVKKPKGKGKKAGSMRKKTWSNSSCVCFARTSHWTGRRTKLSLRSLRLASSISLFRVESSIRRI